MPIGDTIQPAGPTGVGGNGGTAQASAGRPWSQHPLTDYTRAQVQAEAQAALALIMGATPVD